MQGDPKRWLVISPRAAVLLKQLSSDPDIEKAEAEFDWAQGVEERFHRDFDGVDFTKR
jgi:hypothetical protein